LLYAAGVRSRLLTADPQVFAGLAILPGLTLLWALRARAWKLLCIAVVELGLALLLYGWVSFLHVWRLD